MSNPNNCSTCEHKEIPDGGHCYMFENAPTEVCMQHTHRSQFDSPELVAHLLASLLSKTK